MQLKQDAPVYTIDGQHVGGVDRVVIDPATNEVSHVVVRQGVLFTEDKVVPLNLISTTTEDEVRRRVRADEIENLPPLRRATILPPRK